MSALGLAALHCLQKAIGDHDRLHIMHDACLPACGEAVVASAAWRMQRNATHMVCDKLLVVRQCQPLVHVQPA
jgi:hypothetical protein